MNASREFFFEVFTVLTVRGACNVYRQYKSEIDTFFARVILDRASSIEITFGAENLCERM